MLQDFSFKIIHRPGLRHTNVDALSRNPIGPTTNDDDFSEEIQDIGITLTNTPRGKRETLFVQTGKEIEWLGVRRKVRECIRHHACCFGINHCNYVGSQQLYVVDVISEEEQPKELGPYEAEITRGVELVQDDDVGVVLKRKRPQYYDKQHQLELALEAQQLFESGEHDLVPTGSNEEDEWGADTRHQDIWKDVPCLDLLQKCMLPDTVDYVKARRARKRVLNYHW